LDRPPAQPEPHEALEHGEAFFLLGVDMPAGDAPTWGEEQFELEQLAVCVSTGLQQDDSLAASPVLDDASAAHPQAGRAPAAVASLQVLEVDGAGNWPMVMRVRGLKQLPKNGYYELYLTRNGKLGPQCGTFRVHGGTTDVRLNAPYVLKKFNGWVVTPHVPGRADTSDALLTT
jgi:hypothetical protein